MHQIGTKHSSNQLLDMCLLIGPNVGGQHMTEVLPPSVHRCTLHVCICICAVTRPTEQVRRNGAME